MSRNLAAVRRWHVALLGVIALVGGVASFTTHYTLKTLGTSVMNPAVAPGDRMIVDTTVSPGALRRGDIVVFAHGWTPGGPGITVRVAGLPGDTVDCCDPSGKPSVNGTPESRSGVHGDTGQFGPFHVVVPAGRVFVLGDARNVSVDSRSHLAADGGTLPLSALSGRVVGTEDLPGGTVRTFNGAGAELWIAVVLMLAGAVLILAAVWRPVRQRLTALWRAVRNRRRGGGGKAAAESPLIESRP